MRLTSGPAIAKGLSLRFPQVEGKRLFDIKVTRRSREDQAEFAQQSFTKNKSLTWEIHGQLLGPPPDIKSIGLALEKLHKAESTVGYASSNVRLLKPDLIVNKINGKKQVIVLHANGAFTFYHFTTYCQLETFLVQFLRLYIDSIFAGNLITPDEAEEYYKVTRSPPPPADISDIQNFILESVFSDPAGEESVFTDAGAEAVKNANGSQEDFR